jgi:hypothetical protein
MALGSILLDLIVVYIFLLGDVNKLADLKYKTK